MYLEHFGLKELPFKQNFNRNHIYYSRSHEECLTRLLYCVNENKGAALLTGMHGAGKSLLLNVLKEELIHSGYQVVHITHANLPPDQFIEELLYELGVGREGRSKVEMLHVLRDILKSGVDQDKELVVLIDEVQFISSPEVFVEMHQLLNIQINGRCPVSLILVGEADATNRLDDFGPLADRLALKARLDVLNREDTDNYINFRLDKSGVSDSIFSPEAYDIIYRATHGVPRHVNHVADLSLLIAASEGHAQVNEQVARMAVAEWQGLE